EHQLADEVPGQLRRLQAEDVRRVAGGRHRHQVGWVGIDDVDLGARIRLLVVGLLLVRGLAAVVHEGDRRRATRCGRCLGRRGRGGGGWRGRCGRRRGGRGGGCGRRGRGRGRGRRRRRRRRGGSGGRCRGGGRLGGRGRGRGRRRCRRGARGENGSGARDSKQA